MGEQSTSHIVPMEMMVVSDFEQKPGSWQFFENKDHYELLV
jgi:hypothetical protein